MVRIRRIVLLVVLGLAGCGEPQPDSPPIYVYAAYDDVDYLPALFKRFTDDTGTVVVVRHRSDEENLADMQRKAGSQPADVLLTRSVGAIWKAADEGLLRPYADTSVAASVAETFRDPDRLWVAVSIDPLLFITDSPDSAVSDYRKLHEAAPVCVSSSALPQNRALIAAMIADFGRRETELAVRQWVDALGLPPRESHASVAAKVRDGSCRAGLVPKSALGDTSETGVVYPDRVYYDVEGAGIGRHATNPQAAGRLIDWLLTNDVQSQHATARNVLPVIGTVDSPLHQRLDSRGIAAAGFQYQDAILLAERARYR